MTTDELIAQQALRIAEFEESLADYEARLKAIRMIIVGVGGPLNDNKHGYTKIQLGPFRSILEQAE